MENLTITIGQLETKLLELFPRETAEDWDKTGLLVGDPNTLITKIALALDPTVPAIKSAQEKGCNLLITHHPAYLGGVQDFRPGNSVFEANGTVVYEAINRGVALMNFHTALDVSDQGRAALPDLLGLEQQHILCPLDGKDNWNSQYGFGMLNTLLDESTITLEELTEKCKTVFGRTPRTWGKSTSSIKKIGTTTGSTGSGAHVNNLLSYCYQLELDCLICGEIKYHDALALSNSGICIIDLGHDVSEIPLVAVLFLCLSNMGVDENDIICIDQLQNWI